MADVEPRMVVDSEQILTSSTELLPVLVISSVQEDDDELLFEPESPPSSRTSSVGTPPTPDHSKFVWSARRDARDEATDERPAEPTTLDVTVSFDSFTQSKPMDAADGCFPCDEDIECSSLDRSFSMVSTLVEDGDHEERLSMLSSSSRASALYERSLQTVKEKTQKAANQPREAISRFQLKGGLVGWLHGEGGDAMVAADGSTSVTPSQNEADTSSMESAPTNAVPTPRAQRKSSVFGSLYGKMKQKQEQLELKLQSLENASTDPSAMLGTHRVRQPQARLSLQPTSRRSLGFDQELSVGFDDFVSTTSTDSAVSSSAGTPFLRRDSRLRSASSGEVYHKGTTKPSSGVRSRLRSLSFATRSSKPPQQTTDTANSVLSTSALQWDAFPMEECLADPKLAAEFINTVMPGDEWLLTLLYSIEEYETLTTTTTTTTTTNASSESTPSLDTQVSMATTIIDRFLTAPTCAKFHELETMGTDIRGVVSQYQLSSDTHTAAQTDSDITGLLAAQGAALPMNLFDGVYTFVFDRLRDAYDAKFRLTREYTQLLAHMKQQQQQLGDEKTLEHLVLSFDQVIESEWCCTVFWVYLFRSSHHHRLSFIMEVKFKLRRLHLAAQQSVLSSSERNDVNKQVQHQILLICRRFLSSKLAPLALPTTSPMLVRLKEELQRDAAELDTQVDEPDAALMQRMIEKLDAMRTQTRVDFKRMSFERFASFLTSALYRDYIVHPGSATSTQCTRADDLTQLLRTSRIPFHQTAVSPPKARDLRELATDGGASDVSFDKAVAMVFTFQRNLADDDQQFVYRSLFVSPLEDNTSVEGLRRKVESFLVPEGLKSTGASTDTTKRSSVCFNFLAGTGDDTVYGAVWRFGATNAQGNNAGEREETTKDVRGVVLLSRYPLVDGLREYLRTLALERSTITSADAHILHQQNEAPGINDTTLVNARRAFEAHCSRLRREHHPTRPAEVMDSTFHDLFECLSITNAMRLFSLILQEKKLVLVSSSYSVLLAVGEALRVLVSPLVWSHIYVPVLPMGMKGYLHCPTPFIFGLHTSYVRHCELPKPSDDFVVVNLDRDSVTGGGDVFMPPLRANALREQLTALCKPRLRARDDILFQASGAAALVSSFPSIEIRHAFRTELLAILRHLETFAFRFECADRTVSVVDTSNKSRQWPADAARFYAAVLQSQAFSTYLGGSS